VMSIPPKVSGGGINRSIDTVMAERPCRVILQADPEARTVAELSEAQEANA
jgi:APA family basic amino acid/polyamine antiporter